MKTRGFFLLVAALLSGSTALAQCSDGQDEICIFWSPNCVICQNCAISVGTPITAFIVLINASLPSGVRGFEFKLVNSDGPFFPVLPKNSVRVGIIAVM